MRIHSVDYTEYGGQSYAWTVEELLLIDINLIVGKNATGKSRVLRVINGVARLIEGSLTPATISSGNYRIVLKDDQISKARQEPRRAPKPDMVYLAEIHESKVLRESLEVGGVPKLPRGKTGRGKVFFEKNKEDIDVQIPEGQLAATSRRDLEQHAFFEDLHKWAASVRYYESARTEANAYSAFQGKVSVEAVHSAPLQSQLHLAIKSGQEKFGRDLSSAVISDMRKVGYEIEAFGLMPAQGLAFPAALQADSGTMQTLYVSESGVAKKLAQNEISDGMLRALATLIFLHFIRLQRKGGCFLIDDIGEGLDFDRSTRLIQVVTEHAEKGHIQLVMTTNDRFVMNHVPLDYWSIIQREKGNVRVFNRRNAADRFAEFEEFGFNNFDFFAKQFFSTGVETKDK